MKLDSIIVLILTLLIATLINLSEQRKCLHIDPLTYLINITVLELYPTRYLSMWPDWAICWTLGSFSKLVATISLTKSATFVGNFSKGVKIFNFSSEIIFGNFYTHLATFYWSHFCRMIRLFAFQSMNSFNFYCLKIALKIEEKEKRLELARFFKWN